MSLRGLILKPFYFSIVILFSLVMGVLIGLFFKPLAVLLLPLGKIYMILLGLVVVPLVLTAIVLAVVQGPSVGALGKLGLKTILFFVVTTVLASFLGIIRSISSIPQVMPTFQER